MHNWRQDPATDRQKRRMKEEGVRFKRSITKGEASDLIGETEPAGEYDVAILKYFRIPGAAKMSDTAAGRKVAEIFSDPVNKAKWENRGADSEQKAIYKFFQIPIPSGLKHKDAAELIGNLFEEEGKAEAWDAYQDAIDEREGALEDAYEMLDMDRDMHDCKKISKRQFRAIAEALERDGMQLNDMAEIEHEDQFFIKAFELFPKLRKEPRQPSSRHWKRKRQSGLGWLLLIILILIIIGALSK